MLLLFQIIMKKLCHFIGGRPLLYADLLLFVKNNAPVRKEELLTKHAQLLEGKPLSFFENTCLLREVRSLTKEGIAVDFITLGSRGVEFTTAPSEGETKRIKGLADAYVHLEKILSNTEN